MLLLIWGTISEEDTSLSNDRSISLDISTFQGKQYFGSLRLGDTKVKMQLILDSGSSMLWFPKKECSTCSSGTVRYDTSSSQTYRQISSSIQSYKFDGAELRGYTCEDEVWLTDVVKVDSVPCFAVTE